MVIDFPARCHRLGREPGDYAEANRIVGRKLYALSKSGRESIDGYIDAIKSLPEKAMIAKIRYDELYKSYPKVFDFDGPIPGVEAPYPYAGRDD